MANVIDQKLRASLLDPNARVSVDPAEKIEEIKKNASARGVSPTDTSRFRIKAIRIGNQMIAQEELAKTEIEFDRMAKMLVSYSGLKNDVDIQKSENFIKERARAQQAMIVAKSIQLQELLMKHNIAKDKSASIMGMWANLAQGVGRMAVAGFGSQVKPEKPESVAGVLTGPQGGFSKGEEVGGII